MVTGSLERKDIKLFPMDGVSYRGYMKIDHIATGNKIIVDNAIYKDMFCGEQGIGIPDHSCIVATLRCA